MSGINGFTSMKFFILKVLMAKPSFTRMHCCQTKKKLYEPEALYADAGFIRVSKTAILSLSRTSEIIPGMGRRLKLPLINGEYKCFQAIGA